jgi:hypothetical protein
MGYCIKEEKFRHGNSKLNEDEVAEIRQRYIKGKIRMRDLADDYDVSEGLICQIINRKIYL